MEPESVWKEEIRHGTSNTNGHINRCEIRLELSMERERTIVDD